MQCDGPEVRCEGPKGPVRGTLHAAFQTSRDLRSFWVLREDFRSSKLGAIHAPCIGMAAVRPFEDFDCWKLSNELKLAIYELVERAHVKPDRDFCDQIRSAVASAPANIAEGFGRRSDAEFARFLDIARGSLNECRNHIGDARDRNYIDENERSALDVLASRAVGAVAGLQRHLRRGKRKRT